MNAPFFCVFFKAYQIWAPQKGLLRESNVRFGSLAAIPRLLNDVRPQKRTFGSARQMFALRPIAGTAGILLALISLSIKS